MGTTADKLARVKEAKEAIKAKLIEKGVTVSDTDTFLSYAAKMDEIQGGGSADVKYVTFMNGATEHYKKAVATGDDCVDVVVKGLVDAPTQASTDQYEYTLSGWSLTPDGEASADALTNVTEDRVVYAVYTATVRKYTITFCDEDGTTVLNTLTLAYGETPSYTPTKDGFSFNSWSPEITVVTGNATYTAVWVEKVTFAGGSWSDIARISESGEAANYFAKHETKKIDIDFATGTQTVEFEILAADETGLMIISKPALFLHELMACETDMMYHKANGGVFTHIQEDMDNMLLMFPTDVQSHMKSKTLSCVQQVNNSYTNVDVTSTLWCATYTHHISKYTDNTSRKKYGLTATGLTSEFVSYGTVTQGNTTSRFNMYEVSETGTIRSDGAYQEGYFPVVFYI